MGLRVGKALPFVAFVAFGCGDGDAPASTSTGDNVGGAPSMPGAGGFDSGAQPGILDCTPGTKRSCYDGSAETKGVGLCIPGVETCLPNGAEFGPCEGQVLPTTETCATTGDDDCDGQVNEGGEDCACVPGATQPCYSFTASTQDVGICTTGTQVCNDTGDGYEACLGEVGPALETCDTPEDEDCDGLVNESGSSCVCTPNATIACYSGPADTKGVGSCTSGTATCNADGTDLGPCLGEVLPANDPCTTPDDENCDGIAPSCPGGYAVWAKQFGGNQAAVSVIAGASTGPLLLAGTFGGSLDFGGLTSVGPYDIWLAQLDNTGVEVWSHRFGDASAQQAPMAASIDAAGNAVVVGQLSGTIDFGGGPLTSSGTKDAYIVKLDAAGGHQWSQAYPGNMTANDIGTDPQGNLFVAGSFLQTINLGGGPLTNTGFADAFIGKLSSSGAHLWTKQLAGSNAQEAKSLAATQQGEVVVAGEFTNEIQIEGIVVPSVGFSDIFVVKHDASGDHQWTKTFGSSATDAGPVRLALDAAENVVFAARFGTWTDLGDGPRKDIVVAKLDPNGTLLWSEDFVTSGSVAITDITADSTDNIVVTGRFNGTLSTGAGVLTSQGNDDIFVVKLSSSGLPLWSKRFGSVGVQSPCGVVTAADDALVIAGTFDGLLQFSPTPQMSALNGPIFLAKLAP